MPAAQVKPSGDFGTTDSHAERLTRFNEVLAQAGRPQVQDIVTVKARPVTATGPHDQAKMWGEEYMAAKTAVGIGSQPTHPIFPYYLVSSDDATVIVYEEHETGLEIVIAGVTIIDLAVKAAPYVSRFIGRVRGLMPRYDDAHPTSPRRTRFSVEVHADDRGYPVTTVAVEGPFDEAATRRLIAGAGKDAADAFAAASRS
jgi:hypothetical protein